MMLLALETSTRMGSIALLSEGGLIAEYQLGVMPSYSEMLLPVIDRVLHDSGITMKAIDIFAVAQGPGSFTALRMGMSVILGLSIATQKNIIPVPSLDGLAYNAGACDHVICPMLDARRGEVYYALYHRDSGRQLKRITPYRVAAPERVLQADRRQGCVAGRRFHAVSRPFCDRSSGTGGYCPRASPLSPRVRDRRTRHAAISGAPP